MSFGNDGTNPFAEKPNPYSSPQTPGGAPDAGRNRAIAESKVKGPAIALMVLVPLGIIFLIFDLVGRVIGLESGEPPFGAGDPGVAEGFIIGTYVGLFVDVIAMVLQVVVFMGAMNMLKLRKRSMAMAACVISVIPCISACCILGIPFGIWGLVALNDPVVKAAFRD
jgi:hypothetical protein